MQYVRGEQLRLSSCIAPVFGGKVMINVFVHDAEMYVHQTGPSQDRTDHRCCANNQVHMCTGTWNPDQMSN
jgi:hypothetical protein